MIRYLVLELQTNTDNTMGSQVTSFDDLAHAEAKYHTVLAAAALSTKPIHSAILMTNQGYVQEAKCYEHNVEEPEPTPEPE